MQDIGNVGHMAIDFMNKSFDVKPFRGIPIPFPRYAIDNIGHIDFQQEKWQYRYGLRGSIIIFEGASRQQKTNQELLSYLRMPLTSQVNTLLILPALLASFRPTESMATV